MSQGRGSFVIRDFAYRKRYKSTILIKYPERFPLVCDNLILIPFKTLRIQ